MTQPYAPPPPATGYAQPPAPAPEKKTPFFKKKWFLILVAIVVVAIIASQASGGGQDGDTSADGGAGSGSEVDVAGGGAAPAGDAGIGQPAADGKFNFVVSGVDCSQTRIGNPNFGTDAQGQFCIVSLTVTNIGDEPQSFFGENATLFNAEGQQFSADTEASIYLENSASIYEEINPGNTLSSMVVFDVPAGTVPASIELHDSAFSGGVTVSLQ